MALCVCDFFRHAQRKEIKTLSSLKSRSKVVVLKFSETLSFILGEV